MWASWLFTRRAFARVLSTFLCCVVVVIRPFSRFGGSSAFLVLTVKELVFSVQGDLAQQLEVTILNLAGALVSIGTSALALYFSSLLPYDSPASRTIPAVFLAVVVFIAGWLKSRLPRLGLSTRIAMFLAIFMMTDHIGDNSKVLPIAGNYLWIVLCAAIIPLVCGMLLLEWSSARFATDLASAFGDLHTSLSSVLACAFEEKTPTAYNHTTAQSLLLKKSVTLNANYQQASFELRLGRLSVKAVRPLIAVVEYTRRELAWGMSFDRVLSSEATRPGNPTIDAFRAPAQDLGQAILDAMNITERAVRAAYQHSSLLWHPEPMDAGLVQTAIQKLEHAQTVATLQLRTIADAIDVEQRTSTNKEVTLSRDLFDMCLFMASLLQMAREMRHALAVSHRLTTTFTNSHARLWLPHLSLAWLGAPPGNYALDDPAAMISRDEDDEVVNKRAENDLSATEAQQGLEEHESNTQGYLENTQEHVFIEAVKYSGEKRRQGFGLSAIPFWIRRIWASQSLMRLRLATSKFTRAVRHSSHLRHALKNAVGVAMLSLPAFLPKGSTAQKWFIDIHGQWMVISYMWILETNTGATWRSGYLRLSGTISGAVYAYITWLICKRNPYGLVVLITFSDLPITWLILNTSIPPLGIVAAITLPPIALLQYVNPYSDRTVTRLAVDRGLMIGAGIIAALLMNGFVFPRHCRVLYLSSTSRALNLLNQMYMNLSRDTIRTGFLHSSRSRKEAIALEVKVRGTIHRMSLLLVAMNDELSLLPKPIRHYQRMILALQKTLDLLTGLRKVREHIPKKETVADVFRERRELMSCVCMALYACENAFRSRHPLPQFIPSARHAFNTLQMQVTEHIRQAREEDHTSMGLSLVYAFAESEVLRDLIDNIEELLQLSRDLFGSAAWLTETPCSYLTPVPTEPGTPAEEDTLAWYSTVRGIDA